MSDIFLSALALRLAALVLAGLVIRALPNEVRSEATCAQSPAADTTVVAEAHRSDQMDEMLRDMLMHD